MRAVIDDRNLRRRRGDVPHALFLEEVHRALSRVRAQTIQVPACFNRRLASCSPAVMGAITAGSHVVRGGSREFFWTIRGRSLGPNFGNFSVDEFGKHLSSRRKRGTHARHHRREPRAGVDHRDRPAGEDERDQQGGRGRAATGGSLLRRVRPLRISAWAILTEERRAGVLGRGRHHRSARTCGAACRRSGSCGKSRSSPRSRAGASAARW